MKWINSKITMPKEGMKIVAIKGSTYMLPVIRKGEWVNHINDQCDCCFELVPEGFYWIELPPVDDKGDNEDRDTDTSK